MKSRRVKRAEAPKPPAFIASAAISKDRNRGAWPHRSDVSRNRRAGFRAQNRNFILDERFSRFNRKSSDILVFLRLQARRFRPSGLDAGFRVP